MTLETAKRMIEEQGELANKEALAVVRGGMTICENMKDGSRKFLWIKIMPTRTDAESSIEVALNRYRKKKNKQPRKIVEESTSQENSTTSGLGTSFLPKEDEKQAQIPFFFEGLKKKAIEIWREIDSIVMEE